VRLARLLAKAGWPTLAAIRALLRITHARVLEGVGSTRRGSRLPGGAPVLGPPGRRGPSLYLALLHSANGCYPLVGPSKGRPGPATLVRALRDERKGGMVPENRQPAGLFSPQQARGPSHDYWLELRRVPDRDSARPARGVRAPTRRRPRISRIDRRSRRPLRQPALVVRRDSIVAVVPSRQTVRLCAVPSEADRELGGLQVAGRRLTRRRELRVRTSAFPQRGDA